MGVWENRPIDRCRRLSENRFEGCEVLLKKMIENGAEEIKVDSPSLIVGLRNVRYMYNLKLHFSCFFLWHRWSSSVNVFSKIQGSIPPLTIYFLLFL